MSEPRDFIHQLKIYPPANECIYCGAQGVSLTDEHTMPDGLGGRHILPKASCHACQKIINEEFEQYCMRTLFSTFRLVSGLRSKKKRPPLRTSIQVRRHSGDVERVPLDPNELPKFFVLPVFEEPYFCTRQPVVGDTYKGAWWIREPAHMNAILGTLDAAAIHTETIFPDRLARFVAKIAHAHAWAMWGPVFEPFLLPIILGKQKRFIEFVGGWPTMHQPELPDLHHQFRILCWTREGDDTPVLLAAIRFFADLGGPVYYAVIGKLLKPWPLPERQA